jgi:hypothetical protein
VESNWVYSALRPPTGLLCQPRVIMMMGKFMEWLAGKPEVLGENMPQCSFVHHKPHMLLGREPGPPRWEPLELRHGLRWLVYLGRTRLWGDHVMNFRLQHDQIFMRYRKMSILQTSKCNKWVNSQTAALLVIKEPFHVSESQSTEPAELTSRSECLDRKS